MSTTLSHFPNIENLTFGGTAVGSTSNCKIGLSFGRVEGMDNGVIGGPVSSHITARRRVFSFDTEDVSAYTAIVAMTTPETLTFTWIAATTQEGTPLPDQTVTLAECVVDAQPTDFATKALGRYTVSGHCLAASDDDDQLTIGSGS